MRVIGVFFTVAMAFALASCTEAVTPAATESTNGAARPLVAASFSDLACTTEDVEIAKTPDPPINLTGFAVGTGGYELRWERALYDPDHWFALTFIVARMDGTEWVTQTTAEYRPLHYAGSALAGSQTFRVLGVNRCGQESTTGTTVTVEVGNGGPNPASYLTATAVGENTIDLLWRGVGQSSIVYQVERRIPASPWAQVGSVTHGQWGYVDRGLDVATSYEYRVWSAVPAGTGYTRAAVATNIAAETTKEAGTTSAPTPPLNFRAIDTKRGSIEMAWDEPSHDGNSRVIGYSLRVYIDREWVTLLERAFVTSYRHDGLEGDTQYIYRVRADNEKDTGDGGNWNTESFRTGAIGEPAPSLNLAGQQSRGRVHYIAIAWQMPTDWYSDRDGHNRARITSDDYTLQRKVDGGAWATITDPIMVFARFANSIETSGLKFDTTYTYRVRYKESPWSECSISFSDTVTGHTTHQKRSC